MGYAPSQSITLVTSTTSSPSRLILPSLGLSKPPERELRISGLGYGGARKT